MSNLIIKNKHYIMIRVIFIIYLFHFLYFKCVNLVVPYLIKHMPANIVGHFIVIHAAWEKVVKCGQEMFAALARNQIIWEQRSDN